MLNSIALAGGGEIMVLKMGRPLKIQTLAERMIRLYGYEPHRDIQIRYTGLRPGEKMEETLISSAQQLVKTSEPTIDCLKEDWPGEDFLPELEKWIQSGYANPQATLARLVPEFNQA